ncbi:MAG: caspase family protein [Bacteroidota bacterium]
MDTCYALLVGIKDYPKIEGFADLEGCVKDAERVRDYLDHFLGIKEEVGNNNSKKADVLMLTDEEATKEAVVNGIKNHLGKAGPKDIAFFFYSGHGAQEPAPPIFTGNSDGEISVNQEADGLLESILCYDSRPFNLENRSNLVGTDLCDKELRYLFHEVSKKGAQIVALFDCCNSGDNVRSDSSEGAANIKFYSNPKNPRKWEEFIFGHHPEPTNTRELDKLLPEVEMIQFSASRSDQFAKELESAGRTLRMKNNSPVWEKDDSYGGIFINGLLDVLTRAEAKLSYYDLAHRIRIYLEEEEQTPLLYASGKAQDYLFEGFLGADVSQSETKGRILSKMDESTFDDYWVMDLGVVHGLPADGVGAKILIKDEDDNEMGLVGLRSVSAISSVLEIDSNSRVSLESGQSQNLDTRKTYSGYIQELGHAATLFQLKNLPDQSEDALMEAKNTFKPKNVILSSTQKGPYQIGKKNNEYTLSRSDSSKFLPIIKPAKDEKQMMKYIEQVAHWEMVKDLKNVSEKFKKKYKKLPLDFQVYKYRGKTKDRLKIKASHNSTIPGVNQGDFILKAFKKYKGSSYNNYGEYDIELTNKLEDISVFVAPLMLNLDFSISAFRSGGISFYEIGPEQSFTLPMGILFDQPKHLIAWEKDYQPAHLKFLIATRELSFDVQALLRDPLPAPDDGDTRYDWEDKNSPDMAEWTSQLLTLQLKKL